MTEKPNFDYQAPTGGIPNQLNIFWEDQAGNSDVLTDGSKTMSATVFFHERLAPLKTTGRNQDRDKVVGRFKTWIPFSEREETIVMQGPKNKITWANRTKNGNPKRAVQKTYETFAGQLKDSFKQLDLLEQVLIIPEDADPVPDVLKIRELIKNDTQFRALFADYFYYKEALDHYGEPKNKKRKSFFHGAVIAAAEHTTDDTVEAMFSHIYLHSIHRKQYWTNRIAEVTELDFVKEALADPEYTPPSLLRPRRLEDHLVEPIVSENVASRVGEAVLEGKWAEAMPPEVLAANIKRYADQTAQIDRRLQHSQATQYQVELDVLGGKAIRDDKGNVIGVEAKDEQMSFSPSAAYKPKVNRWPESGPSDKRVEKDHF